jgi:hypothetical protein
MAVYFGWLILLIDSRYLAPIAACRTLASRSTAASNRTSNVLRSSRKRARSRGIAW